MKVTDELYKTLLDVYKITLKKVKEVQNQGKLMKIPCERILAKNLKFSYGHSSFQYDYANIEYLDFYEWNTNYFNDFLDKEIKPLQECDSATNLLCSYFKVSDDRKIYVREAGIYGFVRFLMKQIPNDKVNDRNISSYINILLNDFNTDNQFTWKVTCWLGSINFESESIKIGNFEIRKPILDELNILRQKSQHIDDFDKITGKTLFSSAVLEFSMKAERQVLGIYSDSIRHEIECCIDAMRLFKVGNVFVTYQSVTPISILNAGHTESLEPPFDKSWKDKIDYEHTSNYEYTIQKNEEASFCKFFQKIKPLLKSIPPKNYLSGNYLDLALHRYKDSLLRSEVNVNRIVSAISCLEALLSNSQSEITYKISIHVAAILRCLGFDSIRVFEKMKTAYKIRSTVLHGSKLDKKRIAFSKNHTHEVVNYARLCLLISIQLKNKFSKDQLIAKIDYSLINSKHQEELQKVIAEDVFIPQIYPYRKIENGDEFENKKIACIGWGSLIWNPKDLKITGEWFKDGPKLPLEFVRKSKDGRITLVIDTDSTSLQTLWVRMNTNNLGEAILSLKEREESDKIEFVKATDTVTDPIKKEIVEWLQMKKIDVAIWTGLGSKFDTNRRPTLEEVITYLKNLDVTPKKIAEEYIRKAPEQITTAYRKEIERVLGWAHVNSDH